jgi:hypothetical protein
MTLMRKTVKGDGTAESFKQSTSLAASALFSSMHSKSLPRLISYPPKTPARAIRLLIGVLMSPWFSLAFGGSGCVV